MKAVKHKLALQHLAAVPCMRQMFLLSVVHMGSFGPKEFPLVALLACAHVLVKLPPQILVFVSRRLPCDGFLVLSIMW